MPGTSRIANDKAGWKDGLVPALLVAAAVPAAIFIVDWFKNKKKKRKLDILPYPPGPAPRPIVGNLLDFPRPSSGMQLDEQLLRWSLEHGPIFTLHVPLLGRLIICSDPDLIKHVTVTRNLPKSRSTYKNLRPVVGSESMVTLEGKAWAAKRRSFNPGFSPGFLKTMVATMADKLTRFLVGVERDASSGEPTPMLERAQTFTSDVIVAVAFGEDWGGSEAHPTRTWLNDIAALSQEMMLNPVAQMFGFGRKWQIRNLERRLDKEMRAVLERRLASDAASSDNAGSMDICSLAIREIQRENGGEPLSEHDKLSVTHQLKTFYFAGHDTTAILIAWAIWLLSWHVQVLADVRAELDAHGLWKDRTPKLAPAYEDLQKCTYLDAVLRETLRLYPPVGGVVRHSTDANESYKGYKIGGADVIVAVYAMHRHPSLWKAPDEFRPSRFLDGTEDRLHDKFLPFSRGPRDCIGKNFALLEAKLAVSALVVLYDLECVDPNDTVHAQLTNQPKNGARIRFRRRETSESR